MNNKFESKSEAPAWVVYFNGDYMNHGEIIFKKKIGILHSGGNVIVTNRVRRSKNGLIEAYILGRFWETDQPYINIRGLL